VVLFIDSGSSGYSVNRAVGHKVILFIDNGSSCDSVYRSVDPKVVLFIEQLVIEPP
jgi:hypothetical protein